MVWKTFWRRSGKNLDSCQSIIDRFSPFFITRVENNGYRRYFTLRGDTYLYKSFVIRLWSIPLGFDMGFEICLVELYRVSNSFHFFSSIGEVNGGHLYLAVEQRREWLSARALALYRAQLLGCSVGRATLGVSTRGCSTLGLISSTFGLGIRTTLKVFIFFPNIPSWEAKKMRGTMMSTCRIAAIMIFCLRIY